MILIKHMNKDIQTCNQYITKYITKLIIRIKQEALRLQDIRFFHVLKELNGEFIV